MFNRFDQATIPVTDAFGMPFSSLRKRQVEESMPEVPLRPNDPAILAANQTNDMGMPIRQQEPQRPFVPEYQPPNPVGDLMPLPGVGGGGATTRQNIPEDENTDQRNGQSINPLSSIALSKLQDFEAQGVPQQNPKLWQKLLALAAGAGSVVAAMNAERVRPDTQALSNMTNSILYPNEERNRARWMDQRALLRDAVRSEQTGNENIIRQGELQRKTNLDQSQMAVNKARADMYTTRAQQNIAKMLEAGKIKPEEAKLPATFEAALTQLLVQDMKSPDPNIVNAAKKKLEELNSQKRSSRIPAIMEAELSAIADEIRKANPNLSDDDVGEMTKREYGKRSLETKGKQVEAGLENKAASTANLKRSAQRPLTPAGRQTTPEQQLNSAANKIAEDALATTSKDGVYDGAAAAKAVNAITDLPPEVKNRALKLVNAKIRSGGNNDMAGILSAIDNLKPGNKAPTPPPAPPTPPKPGTKTILRYGKDGNPIY